MFQLLVCVHRSTIQQSLAAEGGLDPPPLGREESRALDDDLRA